MGCILEAQIVRSSLELFNIASSDIRPLLIQKLLGTVSLHGALRYLLSRISPLYIFIINKVNIDGITVIYAECVSKHVHDILRGVTSRYFVLLVKWKLLTKRPSVFDDVNSSLKLVRMLVINNNYSSLVLICSPISIACLLACVAGVMEGNWKLGEGGGGGVGTRREQRRGC